MKIDITERCKLLNCIIIDFKNSMKIFRRWYYQDQFGSAQKKSISQDSFEMFRCQIDTPWLTSRLVLLVNILLIAK